MIIAVDFDGTIVDHQFPEVGPAIPGAIQWLKQWQEVGAKLILWTNRSGGHLDEAVAFCRDQGIVFWGINKNPDQWVWSRSPKVYADLFVDDRAFGIPMTTLTNRGASLREVVDWKVVGPKVFDMILKGGKS